jgi:hypothetical protein
MHADIKVEIKVLQENMMNNTKCRRELEWTLTWGIIDGIHHYNYHKTERDQHHLPSDIFDMDSQVEESSQLNDGRIQIR